MELELYTSVGLRDGFLWVGNDFEMLEVWR